MNPLIDRNPLHIPEVRAQVSRLVSRKDAFSCVRVSKAWSEDFTPPIWRVVNFEIHKTFKDLDGNIITKHGHHIRTIKNLTSQAELIAVLRPTVKNVQVLKVTCTPSARFRTLCMDLISNNSQSLKTLRVGIEVYAKLKDYSTRVISLNAFVLAPSVCQLVDLSLNGVCFSRDSFASLLRNCPLLICVNLHQDVALFSGPSIDTFQHTGVVTLLAPIKQVFKPDPESGPSSLGFSLLVHFPNLLKWHCYNLPTALFVPVERIKSEVITCCPQLTSISTWVSPQPIIYTLVANAFSGLTQVTFDYSQLSMDIIVALLFHRATLTHVITLGGNNSPNDTEIDEALSINDHFRESGRAVQLLPRSCSHLTLLNLEHHEMDMDVVEEEEWACTGLQHLRVRVRGLDTKDKIDRTLNLWKEWNQELGSHKDEEEDSSMEVRVARYLFLFVDLRQVWLGTRTFYA